MAKPNPLFHTTCLNTLLNAGKGSMIRAPERAGTMTRVPERAGTMTRVPALADVPYPVQMEPNLVVEYYSR